MDHPGNGEFEGAEGRRLCQACHETPAVVRVIKVEDGEEVEAWLCRECARTDAV